MSGFFIIILHIFIIIIFKSHFISNKDIHNSSLLLRREVVLDPLANCC